MRLLPWLSVLVCLGACNCDPNIGLNDGGTGGGAIAGGHGGGSTGGGSTGGGSTGGGSTGGGSTGGGSTGGGSTGGGSTAGGGAGGGTGGQGGGALPPCAPHDGGLLATLPSTRIVTVHAGAPLIDPVGLTFGPGGLLYVANSSSWLSGGTTAGTILRLEANGTFTTFVSDSRLAGPGWVAFAPSTDGGSPAAYMGTEDSDEFGARSGDQLLVSTNGVVSDALNACEVGRLEYVNSGTFAEGLYFTAREQEVDTGPPNPSGLLRWMPGSSSYTVVRAISSTGPVGAVQGFAFGHGGTLGNDLYLSTLLDGVYTPDASVGVWRVDAGLQATALVTDVKVVDLAASPSPTGAWGDFLYGSSITADGGGALIRIASDGGTQDVASRLQSYGSVTFGPDGALYFTDIAGHAIHRLERCTP